MPAEGEAVQMGVGPVERHLQHLMYDVERQARAQIEPAPDRRLGVIKVDPDSIDRDLIARWSPELGSRQRLWPSGSEAGQLICELAQVGEFRTGNGGLESAEQLGMSVVVGCHRATVALR
jgi:hypothetical protein